MKEQTRSIIKWIFFGIGCLLLLYALWNTYDLLTPEIKVKGTITPVADQEGFAPMVIPEYTPSLKIFEPTDAPITYEPRTIVIGKIELEAPIVDMEQISVKIVDQDYAQFLVPEEFAAGWHAGSAPIGVPGNTVISGHHNAYGSVFKDLHKLEIGDVIKLLNEDGEEFKYYVSNKMIFPEQDESLEVRLENGRWIQPTDDERLTVVTCWPEDSNSHRLIYVAIPEPDLSMYEEQPPLPDYIKNIDLKTPIALHLVQQTVTPQPLDECKVNNISPYAVNIRANPSLNGEIIGEVAPGAEATCFERDEEGNWIKISYEDIKGWISTGVVELQIDIDLIPVFEE